MKPQDVIHDVRAAVAIQVPVAVVAAGGEKIERSKEGRMGWGGKRLVRVCGPKLLRTGFHYLTYSAINPTAHVLFEQ